MDFKQIARLHLALAWFGIFIIMLIEIAEITPPVGFNLFVLQNMTGGTATGSPA